MQVQVRLFASYRDRAGTGLLEVSLPEGATVEDLLAQLCQQVPALGGAFAPHLVAVNSEYAPGDQSLSPGDEVALIPPVSGGGAVRITREPLNAREIAEQVRHETNGAVVVFEGTARRFTNGRRVLSLEYEAYVPMAEKKLAEVAEELRRRWDVEGAAIYHRIGRVEIGETSLVVAVGSPHRKEAFAAAQYAVDRIKQTVPIWKKEVFEDGEVWVGTEAEHAAPHL